MFHRIIHTAIILLTFSSLTLVSTTALAQKNNNNNKNNRRDEQRENERVKRAEHEVSDARKQLAEKQTELKAALRKVDAAQVKVQADKRSLKDAEDAAESELGASLGIPEAIAKVNSLQKDYEAASKPILDSLHARPEWSKVQADAAMAKADRELLRENTELEDDEREAQLKKLAAIIQQPFNVEAKALAADSKCVESKKLVEAASLELAQLRKKLTPGKVEKHPKVFAAQKALDEAQKALSKDEQQLAAVRSACSKAQRALNTALSELSRAKQADAMDSNKGKKK